MHEGQDVISVVVKADAITVSECNGLQSFKILSAFLQQQETVSVF